ncbi:MAG: hypothetical protein Q8M64_18135, partial [Methyloversatilis sp.]|nr:hypothetical protein [Methyloversatilis sp.]
EMMAKVLLRPTCSAIRPSDISTLSPLVRIPECAHSLLHIASSPPLAGFSATSGIDFSINRLSRAFYTA